MKTIAAIIFSHLFVFSCAAQNDFDAFIKRFPVVQLPLDSIQFVKYKDTLEVKVFNKIAWDSQPREEKNGKSRVVRPKVYKNGKLLELGNFGKANDTPLNYEGVDGKVGKFYTRLYPVARINLHPEYLSIVVKTFNSELSYYDLYNFTKDGKRLSAVPLFTYMHNNMLEDKIDYVITRSTILKDGSIPWLENNRGAKTSRIYKLRDDGYFEIVKEEKSGKFEY